MVLDGSERVDNIIKSAMMWDVMGGVARAFLGQESQCHADRPEYNHAHRGSAHITLPYIPSEKLIKETLAREVLNNVSTS